MKINRYCAKRSWQEWSLKEETTLQEAKSSTNTVTLRSCPVEAEGNIYDPVDFHLYFTSGNTVEARTTATTHASYAILISKHYCTWLYCSQSSFFIFSIVASMHGVADNICNLAAYTMLCSCVTVLSYQFYYQLQVILPQTGQGNTLVTESIIPNYHSGVTLLQRLDSILSAFKFERYDS